MSDFETISVGHLSGPSQEPTGANSLMTQFIILPKCKMHKILHRPDSAFAGSHLNVTQKAQSSGWQK
jgi:hypothetical protein